MQENLIDKIPPQNLEAERAVLGSMLIEEEAIIRVIEYNKEEDFYSEAHQEIFKTIIGLYNKDKKVDFVIVAEELKKEKKLKGIGGATYLSNMIDSVATAANIEYYAKIVKEKSVLRKLIKMCSNATTKCYNEEESENVLTQIEESLFSVYQDKEKTELIPVGDLIKDSVDVLEKLHQKKEKVPGISTGLGELDFLTGGLYPSNLIIIAGRPSMGKTAFCLNIASNLGVEEKKSVAFFSLEMSKEELMFRLLCSKARVDLTKARTGYVEAEEWKSIMNAANEISEAPIYIDDSPALTIPKFKSKVKKLNKEKKLSLIILDYLQLIPGKYRKPEYRRQEIEEITQSLKNFAKELKIPIVITSQLNRASEGRKDRRPKLFDLRESGSIEQDADTVIFIYRDNEKAEETELIVAKQRNGRTDTVMAKFIGKWTKFFDSGELI